MYMYMYMHMRYVRVLTLTAWLSPRLCTHGLFMCAISYGLALALPVYVRFACVLTHSAWLSPHLRTHMPCMCTVSYGLAPALPTYTYYACILLIWFGSHLAYACIFLACTAVYLPLRRGSCLVYAHALCLFTVSYGLSHAPPTHAYACILTRAAWLSPRLCMHVPRMRTYPHGWALASPVYVCHALTHTAWPSPRLCTHGLCYLLTHAAWFSPRLCTCAPHEHLLTWLRSCLAMHAYATCEHSHIRLGPHLAYVHAHACALTGTGTAWLRPHLCTCALHVYLLIPLGSGLTYAHALCICACTDAMHVYLLARLGSGRAWLHRCHACVLTHTAWLWPRLGTQVSCMCTYSHSSALASPTLIGAMPVYLLTRLGSGRAHVHRCHACVLTLTAWLWMRPCAQVLCMCTYSHGLALASPMYTGAVHVYLLTRLGSGRA